MTTKKQAREIATAKHEAMIAAERQVGLDALKRAREAKKRAEDQKTDGQTSMREVNNAKRGPRAKALDRKVSHAGVRGVDLTYRTPMEIGKEEVEKIFAEKDAEREYAEIDRMNAEMIDDMTERTPAYYGAAPDSTQAFVNMMDDRSGMPRRMILGELKGS